MRAAARQASRRIAEQSRAESCGDEDEDHVLETPHEHDQDALSNGSDDEHNGPGYHSLSDGDFSHDDSDDDDDDDDDDYNDTGSYYLRDDQQAPPSFSRTNNPRVDPARAPTRLPLRVAPANYNSLGHKNRSALKRLPIMSVRQNNGIPRQNMRDAIVQQWDPSRRPNGQPHLPHPTGAPPTPPLNDSEEEHAERQRTLRDKIMQQVEENGIERPHGYTVSYHYNRRVENMHFGRTHPMKPWRLTLTKHLVMGYGLQFAMDNYDALPASKETVAAFHDQDYVDFLSKVSPQTFNELSLIYEDRIPPSYPGDLVKLGPFNLSPSPGADCPVFDGMQEYLFLYTGATMEAVSALTNNQSDIAINWSGGLHHAHKSEASGFCYINDIVLGILELLKCHQRVLYIDIDVHHGDGVEEAFASSDRVMTLSFHRYGIIDEDSKEKHLFFPGTGALNSNGNENSIGNHFALNVPIPKGIDDDQFLHLFESITGRTLEHFRPQAIVLQCGADSLGGDRLGQFNLNIRAHGECLAFVKKAGVPLLILGGGGYTARNVARAWTHETALAVGATLSEELPMHIVPRPQAFMGKEHGDGRLYPELAGFHKNNVTQKELDLLVEHCHEELRYIKHAPSVVMESLPSRAQMDAARRQVDDEMEADRAAESSRGERERRRRERGTGTRGELR
ncbi:histone deacetylase [Aureobasidium sp. EXF-10728]|nr:histone deacetylase [Aureobasidium sp. EXF-10728]